MRSEYTVTQVNAYIKNMFTQDFLLKKITVKGEVSNCKYHSSGHIYFTLKDAGAAIACVMFMGDRIQGLKFKMTDGQMVVATGSIGVYERDGKYQLYAKEIKQDGSGALYVKFEELKTRLKESGMFDEQYKQVIPKYIKSLGVVTAPTGAAVRDIINVATRRNPHINIIIYPAIVQGDRAAESIVLGIQTLTNAQVDVIIVGRGGGSIEDLWAFNEEVVAQAIFDCPIPIISAVGHETDTTIADFVSDKRAPTPSAAAELAVFEYDRFLMDLRDYRNTLKKQIDRYLQKALMEEKRCSEALRHLNPIRRIRDNQIRLDQYSDQLERLMEKAIRRYKNRVEVFLEKLKGVSPLDRLKGGYAFVVDDKGKNIRSIKEIKKGDEILVYVSDGAISANVEYTKGENYGSRK